MPQVPVKFQAEASGRLMLFAEPYWESRCGRYRIAKLNCIRPWRLYRRLRKGFKGWQWIGVDVGFETRVAAIVAAWHHCRPKRPRANRKT